MRYDWHARYSSDGFLLFIQSALHIHGFQQHDVDPDAELPPVVSAPGYLYVLVNPSMDSMVKVGKTTRNPALRAQELSSVTEVPTPFLLVFERFFADCDKAEQLVHDALEARGHRISDKR